MLVYLVRHGRAVSEEEDRARPLSRSGEKDILRVAEHMARHFPVSPGRIYHSPKKRAAQTASIISLALSGSADAMETDGLAPMDDPSLWAERLEAEERDAMLVGHLPHMSRLASLLLIWDSGRELLSFTPGTVVCLEKSGGWRLKWMVSPDVLKNRG